MITPEQIRQKAENLYPKVLQAWLLEDDSYFPRTVPAQKTLDREDIAAAIKSVRVLREGSKEARGFGYSIEWAERDSRAFGKNRFPLRIYFETPSDLLRLIGRQREFASFTASVGRLRIALPQLEPWIRANVRRLIECQPELEGLIEVVQYFLDHPRPDRFARELPLSVDTKFIERNRRVLRDWFDVVLPAHTIRADESHFERRYGLRFAQPHLLIRFLDPVVQREVGSRFEELSLPLSALGDLPVVSAQVFVVENKVNLLTLPPVQRGIALGGLGRAVTDLRSVGWLYDAKIFYWGDMDVEGFQILSSLRLLFPHTESFLMDDRALCQWSELATEGAGNQPDPPQHLVSEERKAFLRCRAANLRIEQERIPQPAVSQALARIIHERSAASPQGSSRK